MIAALVFLRFTTIGSLWSSTEGVLHSAGLVDMFVLSVKEKKRG